MTPARFSATPYPTPRGAHPLKTAHQHTRHLMSEEGIGYAAVRGEQGQHQGHTIHHALSANEYICNALFISNRHLHLVIKQNIDVVQFSILKNVAFARLSENE